jgi:hypothetical protein
MFGSFVSPKVKSIKILDTNAREAYSISSGYEIHRPYVT